jgi:hypothetical protein
MKRHSRKATGRPLVLNPSEIEIFPLSRDNKANAPLLPDQGYCHVIPSQNKYYYPPNPIGPIKHVQ